MSVSGTNTFTKNKNEIINLAFARIGVIGEEQVPTSYQVNRASSVLNIMIKSWITKGARLWKTKRGYLFLDPSSNEYILDGINANATNSYTQTTTNSAASSGSSLITVTSNSGFAIGYNIGIVQSNNTILWTTINNVSGGDIALDSPLTSDVISGASVFVYQTKLGRLENIINAQLKISPTVEISMTLYSRDSYDEQSIKTITGLSNYLYHNKQLDKSIIRVFPQPSSADYIVNFTYQEQFYDMDDPLDNFDFPNEWLDAIYLNLALKLCGFYSIKDVDFKNDLKQEAQMALLDCLKYDDENTSIRFEPATDNNRGGFA